MNYSERSRIHKKADLMQKRDYKVAASNDFLRHAVFDLNIGELRALSFITSLIKPTDTPGLYIEFSLDIYCDIAGLNKSDGHVISNVKESIKKLRDESFWMINSKGQHELLSFINDPVIDPTTKHVRLQISQSYERFVIGLTGLGDYTQHDLICTLPMKSNYSYRLYWLLRSYIFREKIVEYDVDELKEIFGCSNLASYKNFNLFKKRVLNPAVDEINEYADIEVTYEPGKKIGKRVVSVIFYIKNKNTKNLLLSTKKANEVLNQYI